MYVCVRARARVHFLLVLVCIRLCSISVCVGGCLCRYVVLVCVWEGACVVM